MSVWFLRSLAKPLTLRALIRGGCDCSRLPEGCVYVWAHDAEAPIWAAYRIPLDRHFPMTDDSIYPFRPNAIRSSFRVNLGLIFGLLSGARFDSSRIGGLIPRLLSGPLSALLGKGGLIPKLLSGPRCDPFRRRGINAKLLSGPRCGPSLL